MEKIQNNPTVENNSTKNVKRRLRRGMGRVAASLRGYMHTRKDTLTYTREDEKIVLEMNSGVRTEESTGSTPENKQENVFYDQQPVSEHDNPTAIMSSKFCSNEPRKHFNKKDQYSSYHTNILMEDSLFSSNLDSFTSQTKKSMYTMDYVQSYMRRKREESGIASQTPGQFDVDRKMGGLALNPENDAGLNNEKIIEGDCVISKDKDNFLNEIEVSHLEMLESNRKNTLGETNQSYNAIKPVEDGVENEDGLFCGIFRKLC